MQKDSERIDGTHFQERIDQDNFFSGGGRAELLAELHKAVVDGVPLLVFNGEDGSGKTVLCQMLEKQIVISCPVISFSRTVESFEDVVKVVADNLGIDESTEGVDGNSVNVTIERIAKVLFTQQSKLLLIFDQAENIYLATLERIRKMLDQMNDAGVSLCVLFSGRPSFQENYEQLLICDFKPLEERYFSLHPLTKEETGEYLRFCQDAVEPTAQANIFNEEVIDKIYAVARGNVRMANHLAEESLASQSDDTSFLVLLDSVADEDDTPAIAPQLSLLKKIQNFPPAIIWTSGVFCLLLVLLLVYNYGEGESEDSFVDNAPVAVTVQKPADVKPEVLVLPKVIVPSPSEKTVPETKEEVDVVEPLPQVIEKVVEREKTEIPEVVQEKPPVKAPVLEVVEPLLPIPPKEKIVELHQSPLLKKRIDLSHVTERGHINVQPRTEVQEVIATNAHLTAEQLYTKRVAAGKSWKRGVKDNMYTIQLMALTSKNAEGNFKKMLVQENYREQATNFFIFKNGSIPPAIHVYYGEYGSMSMARKARNSIPSFLQKHKPYAISIKGAVSKIKK